MSDFTEPSNFKDNLEKPNTQLSTKPPQVIKDLPKETPGRFPLTDGEWKEAKEELIDKNYARMQFPRTMKLHVDPPIQSQTWALVSFIPSSTAVPDKDGCYGVMKIRGVFDTESKADSYSEFLIRQHDSYAVIDYCFVGKPFPIMKNNSMYCAATKEIDIRRKVDETIRQDIKKKREEEKMEMESVQARQRALLADVSEEKERSYDDLDFFVQLKTKKANLRFRQDDLKKRLIESEELLKKVTAEVADLESKHPEYKEQYLQRYKDALEASGIPPSNNPLLAYMTEEDAKPTK